MVLITAKEAAGVVGVSRQMIHNYVRKGLLKAHWQRVGRREVLFLEKEEVEKFMRPKDRSGYLLHRSRPGWTSVREAAQLLEVHPSTIYRWIRAGVVHKVGKEIPVREVRELALARKRRKYRRGGQ